MTKEQDTERVLWGIGTPRTMRPHWALHELSLHYETRAIRTRSTDTQTAEFAKLNPRRKIPVLQDSEFVITESAAIVAYLSDRYGTGDKALVPSGQLERARWLEWSFFVMTELDATTNYVIRRHHGLKSMYGEAPAAVEAAKGYFLKQLSCVSDVLASATYLIGDKFSAADILLTTCLTDAIGNKIALPEICSEYLTRISTRPAYQAAHAVNHPSTQ